MKKIILVLLSVISLQVVNGQNCFEKLADFSGIDHTSSMADIEAAACELRNLLPTQFQDQFKVYDGSFYLHTGSFNGFGYPEAFDKLKNDIQSPYYLLIAAQNEPTKGLYSKFWVDVKLPDITSDGCIPNLNEEASNLVEFVIEKEFNSNGRSPFSYPNALIEGIHSLKSYVEAATACCQTGGDVAQCIDCNNPDNIAAKLLALGFVAEPIQNIGDFDTGSDAIPEISDYANELFTVNSLTAVNIPASYIEQIPTYQAQGLSIKIYITKDENVCSGEWQTIESEIENDPADVIFWHHIHKGEVGLGDELLFSRVFLGGEGSNMRTKGQRLQKRMLGPDPVTAIIGALGSAFSDAMIQTISIYYLDDSVPTGDWGAAFDKINYGSVAWSGFTGLFVVSGKALTIAKAVGAATAEVTYLAFTDDNYSMEQGALDFARVFVSEIIGNAVGGAIGNKLKNANISWFSKKGLTKLAGTIVDETSATSKKLFIKLGKNFENSGLTSRFDDWLWDVSHKYANGWESPFEHIVSRHTAANAPSGKSYFNSKFDTNLDKLQDMINEGANDWADYLKGQGTLIDYKQIGDRVQILLDFSTKKTKFGLSQSDFIGVATDGTPINTIRITINNDVKIYNAFPSKTVQ